MGSPGPRETRRGSRSKQGSCEKSNSPNPCRGQPGAGKTLTTAQPSCSQGWGGRTPKPEAADLCQGSVPAVRWVFPRRGPAGRVLPLTAATGSELCSGSCWTSPLAVTDGRRGGQRHLQEVGMGPGAHTGLANVQSKTRGWSALARWEEGGGCEGCAGEDGSPPGNTGEGAGLEAKGAETEAEGAPGVPSLGRDHRHVSPGEARTAGRATLGC